MFEIYKNKKVFITGMSGFKGSWLAYRLLNLGAIVKGYSLDRSDNNISMFDKIKFCHIKGDINNWDCLNYAINKFEPEIIFHLAAQPLVRESYLNPEETYDTNVMGTVKLYEICRYASSIKVIITITTDKVYKIDNRDFGYIEESTLEGYDPYSCSKVCVEHITDSYRKSFFNNKEILVATARAGNVLGGGDWGKDRIIPDLMRAYINKEEFVLRNPKHIRPWNYIHAVLDGYLLLGEKLLQNNKDYQGAWNFGPSEDACITTRELIKKCIEYWPELNNLQVQFGTSDMLHETPILKLNSSRTRRFLNWNQQKYSIDETIKRTMEWYRIAIMNNLILTRDDETI